MFILCYFKQPINGMKYMFSNRALIGENDLIKALNSSKTKFNSPLINEVQVGTLILLGAYSYFAYKLYISLYCLYNNEA